MSKQLDQIYKKNAQGQYMYWIWGFGLGIFGLVLAYLQVWLATIVVLGISCLWFYRGYKKHQDLEGKICKIAQVNHTKRNQQTGKDEDKPERVECAPQVLPNREYLEAKPNPHVLFTGQTGQGKTTLEEQITQEEERTKIILSLKADDIWLRSGYPVIDVSKTPPNPTSDKSACSSAFATAFAVDEGRAGYMAKKEAPILAGALEKANSMDELVKVLLKDSSDRKSLSSDVSEGLIPLIKSLMVNTNRYFPKIDLTKNVVLDFSGFGNVEGGIEEAKIFYLELVLNQLWNQAKAEKRKFCIVLDEAHVILNKPTTKLRNFLREGRSMGISVYCASQNYHDVDDGIRGMFATKFVFKTDSQKDLQALKEIHKNLGEVVFFAKGEFTDVGFPQLSKFIPIFYLVQDVADLKNITQIERNIEEKENNVIVEEVKPQMAIMPTTSGGSVVVQDREESLRERILQVLDNSEESLAISRVAKALYKSETDRDEKNKVKLVVNNEVNKLVKEEIVDKQALINEKGKKESHIFRRNENLSKFHVTLQNRSVKLLKANNITILNKATHHSGTQGVDVILDSCDLEMETGLKESLNSFNLSVMGNSKPVIILVPNKEQKERYSKLTSVQSNKAKVVLLPELIQAVKEIGK